MQVTSAKTPSSRSGLGGTEDDEDQSGASDRTRARSDRSILMGPTQSTTGFVLVLVLRDFE